MAFIPAIPFSAPTTTSSPSSSTFLPRARPSPSPRRSPRPVFSRPGATSTTPSAVAADSPPATATAGVKELLVPAGPARDAALAEASALPHAVTLSEVDVQWLHVLAEGWASPLRGFMREEEYVQTLHFNAIRTDGGTVNQSVPIVLSVTEEEKAAMEGAAAIALKSTDGARVMAVLRNPSFFTHNKEERVARTFGMVDERHPYASVIYSSGDWLVGGDVEVLEDITYGDGLDEYRLSPAQLSAEYEKRGADAVFFFQLRNPIHNGHALLMQSCREQLIERGFKNPILVVHQIGGKVKGDDIPLQQRIQQNLRVLAEGVLNPETTILGIFPSPMIYAGPTEVQWHAKARMNAGCQFYIVGRDPAGMKHPATSEDMYDPWHGKMALLNAPGLEELEILPFRVAAYDKTVGKMAFFDPSRADDFVFISGTKMRKFAASGETPPDGFMAPSAWQVLVDYYQSKQ